MQEQRVTVRQRPQEKVFRGAPSCSLDALCALSVPRHAHPMRYKISRLRLSLNFACAHDLIESVPMSHKITKVNIKNYRSFCDADLKLSQFTPLIGYNNAGKSNALSALKWLLRKSSLHEDDFHDLNGSVVVTAEIEGVTGDILNRMPERQRTSIEPLVFNERITISRLQEEPNARSTDIKIFVWNEDAGCWTVNPNGIENSIKALLPEPIRIGAMENAAEDAAKAKNTTTIGKLLSEFFARSEMFDEIYERVGIRVTLTGQPSRLIDDGDSISAFDFPNFFCAHG